MLDVERLPVDPSPRFGEYALLDARAERRAEAWHDWETARIAAIVEPGDDVFELGGAVSALTGALAERAGWTFAAATDEAELSALRAALDPVRPHNLTLGMLSDLRAWCGRAEVVVAADWSPRSNDPNADLERLVEMAESALVVTGWRSTSADSADAGIGVELALAFARKRGLEVRIMSTPVDDRRLRTVATIVTGAGHR